MGIQAVQCSFHAVMQLAFPMTPSVGSFSEQMRYRIVTQPQVTR
jgi:hypothetical protein